MSVRADPQRSGQWCQVLPVQLLLPHPVNKLYINRWGKYLLFTKMFLFDFFRVQTPCAATVSTSTMYEAHFTDKKNTASCLEGNVYFKKPRTSFRTIGCIWCELKNKVLFAHVDNWSIMSWRHHTVNNKLCPLCSGINRSPLCGVNDDKLISFSCRFLNKCRANWVNLHHLDSTEQTGLSLLNAAEALSGFSILKQPQIPNHTSDRRMFRWPVGWRQTPRGVVLFMNIVSAHHWTIVDTVSLPTTGPDNIAIAHVGIKQINHLPSCKNY